MTFSKHNLYVQKVLGESFNDIKIYKSLNKKTEIDSIGLFDENQIAIGKSDSEIEFPNTQPDFDTRNSRWLGVMSENASLYMYKKNLVLQRAKLRFNDV